MGDRDYQYDLDQCLAIGRRVGILMAKGLLSWARESLENGWDDLSGRTRETVGDVPLACVGISIRDVNAIENTLSALVIRDLAGYAEQDFLHIPNFNMKAYGRLKQSCERLGLTLPFVVDEETEAILSSQVFITESGEVYASGA